MPSDNLRPATVAKPPDEATFAAPAGSPLERGVRHPQIHIDFYKWWESLKLEEFKFLSNPLTTKQGIAMWAWSRSREILKAEAENGEVSNPPPQAK